MVSYDKNKDDDKDEDNPFDKYGIDDDFIKDFLNDENIQRDIQRMAEEMMKMFSNVQPGKPYVHGFKVDIGPDGKPRIKDFGNKTTKTPEGDIISDEIEPLADIIEDDKKVSVTVEIPGVEKNDIDLKATDTTLHIHVDTPKKKYHKEIDLPCNIKPNTTKATYKNGVLDVVLKRKNKNDKGYSINIK